MIKEIKMTLILAPAVSSVGGGGWVSAATELVVSAGVRRAPLAAGVGREREGLTLGRAANFSSAYFITGPTSCFPLEY